MLMNLFNSRSLCPLIPGLLALVAYWDEQALRGDWVYDDKGTITSNPVVADLNSSWADVWTHDYWGELLINPTSHKSFRPITTLTFKINAIAVGGVESKYWFQVVNVLLHGVVSAMIVPVMNTVKGSTSQQSLFAAILFALHPIHTEAVSNVSSRGEILMTLFYLLGYLMYSRVHLHERRVLTETCSKLLKRKVSISKLVVQQIVSSAVAVLGTMLCTALSLFAKEHGIALGFTCVIHDIHVTGFSLPQALQHTTRLVYRLYRNGGGKIQRTNCRMGTKIVLQQLRALALVFRILLVTACTILLAIFRISLNGGSSPQFNYDQNPPALSDSMQVRMFSIPWVHLTYLRSLILPNDLCCDWSGDTIALLDPAEPDYRIVLVACYLLCMGWVIKTQLQMLFYRTEFNNMFSLELYFAWILAPFVLSSNWFITVGFVKAERVMYCPSIGYCALLSHGILKIDSYIASQQSPWNVIRFITTGTFKTSCESSTVGIAESVPNRSVIESSHDSFDSNANIERLAECSTEPNTETGTVIRRIRTTTAHNNKPPSTQSSKNNKPSTQSSKNNKSSTKSSKNKKPSTQISSCGTDLDYLFLEDVNQVCNAVISTERKVQKCNIPLTGAILMVMVSAYYCAIAIERNRIWGDPYLLWKAAYSQHPTTRHTMYNYAVQLSRRQMADEAEPVLQTLVETDPTDLLSVFMYTMVLRVKNRCEMAVALAKRSILTLEQITDENGETNWSKRDSPDVSRMVTTMALCSSDIPEKGRLLHYAATLDPSNKIAVNEGLRLLKQVGLMKQDE